MLSLLAFNCNFKNTWANGFIWDEKEKNFKSILNSSTFRNVKMKFWQEHYRLENHNFHKESLKLGYYEVGTNIKR